MLVKAREWESEHFHAAQGPAKPFLKWAGGKRALLPELAKYLRPPDAEHTYFEPFLGAGAVFFAVSPQKAVLGDINSALIQTFKVVKSRAPSLIAFLDSLPKSPTHDQYYIARRRFNELVAGGHPVRFDDSVEVAALMIWLNHTCFNGLYRVNASGQFNVPMGGGKDRLIYSASAIRLASAALRAAQTDLLAGSYEKVLDSAGPGDVAYLDPPYEPISEVGNFTEYASSGFSWDDQVRLAELCTVLARRGCRVVVSNSSSSQVRLLYRDFDVHPVWAHRMISSDRRTRSPIREAIFVSRG